MINNIRFKIIAGKNNKIPEFYTILPENARLHNKTTRARGQTEAKCVRPQPRPRPNL